MITTACLDKNVPAMYDLIRQFMLETNWDNEKKLNTLIKNSASGVVNSIASAGSRFAALYAASKHTPSKAASEVAGGMTQIRMLSQMARWEEYTELIAILKVTSTKSFLTHSKSQVSCFRDSLSGSRSPAVKRSSPKIAQRPPNYLESCQISKCLRDKISSRSANFLRERSSHSHTPSTTPLFP